MDKLRIGDTVYRLLPSGTLFVYKVCKTHKDGTVTVEPQGRGPFTVMQKAPASAFSKDPTIEAKPLR